MKKLSQLLALCLVMIGLGSVNAQDENNPWAVNVGINVVDVNTTPRPNTPNNQFFESILDVEENWNIAPSVSVLGLERFIGDNFSVGVMGTFNRITRNKRSILEGSLVETDLQYWGVDGTLSYSLKNLIKSNTIDPFLRVGAGYTWVEGLPEDKAGFGHALAGGGIKFWFTDNVNFHIASGMKLGFVEPRESHFQHIAGLGIAFGGKDTDGDGIYDDEDKCPEVAGLAAFDGCPDTDADGIQDSEDDCPTVAGTPAMNGCADTDGDGIADPKDACPTVAGVAALGGCPDADGDGVKDADDNCPNEAGPAANSGCPYADSDGDGVLDKDDACPNEAGVASRNGCPEPKEISVEVLNELNVEIKSVLFDNNKASIRTESYATLDNIASIMNQYPDSKFLVEGHTDSRGRDSYNLKLSQDRADSVKNYLVGKGISSSRVQSQGFGETRPVASNNTAAGRQANRRVELSLLKN